MKLQRFSSFFKGLALTLCCVLLTVCSQESRSGAEQGMRFCLGVLTPSLFPFMALTNLLVKTGLCQAAGRRFGKWGSRLFRLSGALTPVLLLSLLGGYPVGAGGIAALRRQGMIEEEEARRAALFMVCAGPGFVLNYVGAAVYGSQAVGGILFAAQVIAVLLTGIGVRFLAPREIVISKKENKVTVLPFSQALVESVTAAAHGMLSICAFVVLFSAVLGMLTPMVRGETARAAVYVLLEVCGAVDHCAVSQPVAVVAFAVGFGGLCVHCQIFAALGELGVSKGLFFLFRITQGLLTMGLACLGLRLLPQKAAVFCTAPTGSPALVGGSLLSGTVLLGVVISFFIAAKQIKTES